ncbi:TauD/TfdA family dioxygenase [Calothrix sp. FACHB-1219]|uniref:TauD/TfdA dioxygenase family protein n=1 Tax=unclassified Calothrix TaxID=2619626 RepID=UPI001682D1B8|nr:MULTISPECIES: TauD/TfdA family dioxygenase [unclassified Calothrix]MBD2207158.1 TauD/TfdA family dioxygenase [Calothrix sp. FACHB-168]MBD2221815.1 TauD/TfdA family dioxygenase [Calothrix sp. FACHB-1219]
MGSQHFDIQPVAGRIGAEIVGVDLSRNLSDDIISDIRKTLVKYKVIFFRNQQLDANGQVAFARRFGEVTTAHPTVPSLPGHPEVLDLNYGKTATRANTWHTDVTFVDRPPLGSVLRALVIPPAGGDTIWANSVTAYQDLPEYLRTLADDLWAVHSNAYDYAVAAVDLPEDVKAYRDVFTSTVYETLHPVVRVHPESGEKGLFIGGFVRQVRGLSTTESDDIIRLLQAYITRPENTVRWRWQVGDVAFWDNRSTQHYAIADYGNQPRHVQRVTIAGDLPIGVNGKQSKALKGNSSQYIPSLAAV